MQRKNIPGPKGHWLLGSMRALAKSPFDFVHEQYQVWDDIAQFRAGPVTIYSIGNPAYIQQIFNDNEIVKAPINQKLLKPVMGNGLFVSEGDYWRRQRKILTPIFKPKRIGDYQKLMREPTLRFIEQLKTKSKVNLMPEVTAITAEVVVGTIFGLSEQLQIQKLDKHLEVLSGHFIDRLSNPVRAPRWIPTKSNRDLNSNVNAVLKIVKQLMSKHDKLKGRGASDTLIDALRSAESDDGKTMTRQQLLDEVSTFFLAGHETTAGTLLWAIYSLSKQPQAQQKLRAELREVLGDRFITTSDFVNLPYLRAVVDETLRMYPVAYILGREVNSKDYRLSDYILEKGAWILIPVFSMHRNSKWYADPDTFLPERWLSDLRKELPKNAFMPFGAGKRLCIGEHFARNELMTLLASIYQNFETYKLPEQPEPKIFAGVTLRPEGDLYVGIRSAQ